LHHQDTPHVLCAIAPPGHTACPLRYLHHQDTPHVLCAICTTRTHRMSSAPTVIAARGKKVCSGNYSDVLDRDYSGWCTC